MLLFQDLDQLFFQGEAKGVVEDRMLCLGIDAHRLAGDNFHFLHQGNDLGKGGDLKCMVENLGAEALGHHGTQSLDFGKCEI